MSDTGIASKIFRHQLRKAPRGPYAGGATLGSTDVPATPSGERIGYCRVNSSSAMPVMPVIFAGEAASVKGEPAGTRARYAFYDPDANAVYDATAALLGHCDFTIAGLAGVGPDFLFVSHQQPWKGLLLPEVHRSGTLSTPAIQKVSDSFTVSNDYPLTEAASIWEQIWHLMTDSELPYANGLARRVFQIQGRLAEDEDEAITLSPSSLHYLIRFLEESKVSRPHLAPTPAGYLMARWMSQGQKITIHFYPDGRAEYYLFAPNPRHADRQDMDSSVTTADALVAKLMPFGTLAWMKAV